MDKIELIKKIIVAISAVIVILIVVLLCADKKKIQINKNAEIRNSKYIILITILIVLFITHGLLRNF